MENDDRWTHHRLISPQRPRGQTPTREDLLRDYLSPHQDNSPVHRFGGYDQAVPYNPMGQVYGAAPGLGPQSPAKRKRRKGLRAGMVIASLAIAAVSKTLLPEADAVEKVLQALIGNKSNNLNQIISTLLREHISTAGDLLRCSDDDLRLTGLRVGDIALIRENRPGIATFVKSPSSMPSNDKERQLQQMVAERDAEIASLRQQLAEKDAIIDSLKQTASSKVSGAVEMLSEVAAEAESNLVASRSSRPPVSQTHPSQHSISQSAVPTSVVQQTQRSSAPTQGSQSGHPVHSNQSHPSAVASQVSKPQSHRSEVDVISHHTGVLGTSHSAGQSVPHNTVVSRQSMSHSHRSSAHSNQHQPEEPSVHTTPSVQQQSTAIHQSHHSSVVHQQPSHHSSQQPSHHSSSVAHPHSSVVPSAHQSASSFHQVSQSNLPVNEFDDERHSSAPTNTPAQPSLQPSALHSCISMSQDGTQRSHHPVEPSLSQHGGSVHQSSVHPASEQLQQQQQQGSVVGSAVGSVSQPVSHSQPAQGSFSQSAHSVGQVAHVSHESGSVAPQEGSFTGSVPQPMGSVVQEVSFAGGMPSSVGQQQHHQTEGSVSGSGHVQPVSQQEEGSYYKAPSVQQGSVVGATSGAGSAAQPSQFGSASPAQQTSAVGSIAHQSVVQPQESVPGAGSRVSHHSVQSNPQTQTSASRPVAGSASGAPEVDRTTSKVSASGVVTGSTSGVQVADAEDNQSVRSQVSNAPSHSGSNMGTSAYDIQHMSITQTQQEVAEAERTSAGSQVAQDHSAVPSHHSSHVQRTSEGSQLKQAASAASHVSGSAAIKAPSNPPSASEPPQQASHNSSVRSDANYNATHPQESSVLSSKPVLAAVEAPKEYSITDSLAVSHTPAQSMGVHQMPPPSTALHTAIEPSDTAAWESPMMQQQSKSEQQVSGLPSMHSIQPPTSHHSSCSSFTEHSSGIEQVGGVPSARKQSQILASLIASEPGFADVKNPPSQGHQSQTSVPQPVTPMWGRPSVTWAVWNGGDWCKLSSEPLEKSFAEPTPTLHVPPESAAEIEQVTGVPATDYNKISEFSFGVTVFTSSTTLVRFQDTLRGDNDLSPEPYPSLWVPSQSALCDEALYNNNPTESFPLPGMLDHILMMGGTLCEGSAWRCLPLREQGIAKFAASCRRMEDVPNNALLPELMGIIDQVDIDDVPSHLLKETVLLSLGPDPLPSQIASSLTIAVLKWFDRRYLLSFQAHHYVVTDLNKERPYKMWRISNDH